MDLGADSAISARVCRVCAVLSGNGAPFTTEREVPVITLPSSHCKVLEGVKSPSGDVDRWEDFLYEVLNTFYTFWYRVKIVSFRIKTSLHFF